MFSCRYRSSTSSPPYLLPSSPLPYVSLLHLSAPSVNRQSRTVRHPRGDVRVLSSLSECAAHSIHSFEPRSTTVATTHKSGPLESTSTAKLCKPAHTKPVAQTILSLQHSRIHQHAYLVSSRGTCPAFGTISCKRSRRLGIIRIMGYHHN